jgi:hypothetical protein
MNPIMIALGSGLGAAWLQRLAERSKDVPSEEDGDLRWGPQRYDKEYLSDPKNNPDWTHPPESLHSSLTNAVLELDGAISELVDERIRKQENGEEISEGFDEAIAHLTFQKNLTKVTGAPSRFKEMDDPEEEELRD